MQGGVIIKDDITIAALRLFLLRGYKYVSLVDVANEVGITKGGIYHYFASKEDLLKAAVRKLFNDMKAQFIQIFNQDKCLHDILYGLIVEQQVENYFKSLLGIEQEIDRINGVNFVLEVMQCYPQFQEQIDNNQLEMCIAIAATLKKAMEKCEIRDDVDPEILSVIIFTVVNGHRPIEVFYKERENRVKIMDNLCKLLEKQ